MSVAISYLFNKIGTYTVQESWETGYTALTACQAILDGYLDSNASGYALVFNNNTVSSAYKVDLIILFTDATSVADLQNSKSILRTNNYARISDGVTSSIKASQGSIVDIYKLMKPT